MGWVNRFELIESRQCAFVNRSPQLASQTRQPYYTSGCDLQNKGCSGLRQLPSVLEFQEVRVVEGQPAIRIFHGYLEISSPLQVPGSP